MTARVRLLVMFGAVLGACTAPVVAPRAQTLPGSVVGTPRPQPTTPARSGRPEDEQKKGTAIVRGVIVAGDTGNPLRRAMVNVFSTDGTRASGVASTDAQGRFEIRDLPAGRYNVSASKAGYVSWSYGQRRANQPGSPLRILDGQVVEKLTLALPRGGVVTGQITDEFGDPIANAQVGVMRYAYMNGSRRLVPAGQPAQTDDRGEFRVFGLAPGEYVVSASSRSEGMFAGPNASVSANVEGFVATYYPGTPNASESQRIVVRAAQETTGVSFALVASRLVKVSGRVISATGEALSQHFIQAMPADRGGGRMMMMGGAPGGMTRPDGTFEMNGVAPGTYDLVVRPRDGRGRDGNAEFGVARVSVGLENVDNVLIAMTRGAMARGTIVTDSGEPLAARPEEARLFARAADPDDLPMFFGAQPTINSDWTFEMRGLVGRRILGGGLDGPSDWTLKAVLLNGQDVTDSGVEFVPGRDVDGIQIVFSRQRTELSGTVTDDQGAVSADTTVIVFPENRERRTSGSRHMRAVRLDQDGRYSIRGLPPADYFVVAITSVSSGEWQDPDFLDGLADRAARVSLNDAETKVQNLKVTQ